MKRFFSNRYSAFSLLLFLICICSLQGYSQSADDIKRLEELQQELRNIYSDSIMRNKIKIIRSEYLEIISKSKSFIAFTLGYDISKTDVDELNADLLANGFPQIKDKYSAFVFGYSRMNKKIAGNLLFTVVPGNKVSNSDYEISLRGGGVNFDKGYAFVYTNDFILHAFGGIGWQYHTIKQTKLSNSVVPGLFDLAPGKGFGKITQNTYHATVGLQFDFNAAYKKSNNAGLQTGIRFAYNPALIKGKYKYENDDSSYSPKIGWRQYNLTLLLKVFSKTYFRRK